MTPEEKRELLKDHADTITIRFAGEDRHWFLGKYSFDLAKKNGVDPSEIFGEATTEEELEKQGIDANLDLFARVLWTGFLPFDPGIELEMVETLLSVPDMRRIQDQISPMMNADVDLPDTKKKG